jgi:hypothetical protein
VKIREIAVLRIGLTPARNPVQILHVLAPPKRAIVDVFIVPSTTAAVA